MHHTTLNHGGTTASSRLSSCNLPGFGEGEAVTTPPSGSITAPSVSTRPGTVQQSPKPTAAGKVAGVDTTATAGTTPPCFRFDDMTPQPLCLASGMGRADTVSNILAKRFDAGAVVDASVNTPLTLPAAAAHVDVGELVMQNESASGECRNVEGDSPLVRAVCQRRIDVVEHLLAAEASLSQLDVAGRAALQIALSHRNTGLVEVFVRHGQIPQDEDLDFNNPDTIGYVTVIADLSADRRLSGLMLPAEESAPSFFKKLFDKSDLHQDTQSTLQWLREQGMSMACARLIAAALGKSREELPAQVANPRLLDLYRLSALRCLNTPDTQSRMLEPYRRAAISATAVEKLGTRATWQLSEIARFATVALEKIVAEMSDWVINICVDKTGLDGRVRTDSLSARLCKNGFVKPVAEAIAASWQLAFTAVQEESSAAMPSISPVRVTMLATHAHITERTPAPFARELLRRLDSGELSAKLQAMFDGPVDELLQTLLQFQRERLRQTCLDSVEGEAPGEAPAPAPQQ